MAALLFQRFHRAGAHVRRALRNFRGDSRLVAGRVVAWLIGARKYASQRVPLESISSVLICRINGRLGNTVLLTPLIKRVHELLPQASIDLAIAYPHAGELLNSFPGLRRIILFPHKGRRLVQQYFGALRQLRAQRYDLVLDPIPESTGGRVALSLCRARCRAGFWTQSQWAPLTHAVSTPDFNLHQALLPVFLLSQVIGRPFNTAGLQLTLRLRPDEMEKGRTALLRSMEPFVRGRTAAARAFGFFAHATGLKVIEREWWLEFWAAFRELEPDVIPVEFLPPQADAPTDARYPSLRFDSLRALTAAIAATRMFISPDTGPMHLASSTAVPTVALFHASDPVLYGPLKGVDLAINVSESTPRVVAECCHRMWRDSLRLQA